MPTPMMPAEPTPVVVARSMPSSLRSAVGSCRSACSESMLSYSDQLLKICALFSKAVVAGSRNPANHIARKAHAACNRIVS